MKNTYPYLKILLTIFVGFNIYLLLETKKDRKQLLTSNKAFCVVKDSLDKFINHQASLLLNLSLTTEFQSNTIDKNIFLFDENERKVDFQQLVNGKPILIFKYSSLNCNVCVDEQISVLKQVSSKIGSNNIVLITDYNTPRELINFVRMNQIDFRIYNLRNVEFTSIDKSLPFYFLLDKSFTLKKLFIPIKDDILLTQIYLNTLLEKYF